MIIVTGAIVAKPEHLEEVLRLSLEHVKRSRKEPGCISHAVHRDSENPNRLFFFEQWADHDAIQSHFAVPESALFVQRAAKLCAGAPELHIYTAEKVN